MTTQINRQQRQQIEKYFNVTETNQGTQVERLVQPFIKGGNLFIEAINAPSTVNAGQTFTVEITVGNGAVIISPGDNDACQNSNNSCSSIQPQNGYCTSVQLSPEWGSQTSLGPTCVPAQLIGIGTHTFTGQLTAPSQSGEYNLDITITATGSGESSDSVSRIISVQGGNGGNGGNGNGNNGNLGGDLTEEELLILGGVVIGGGAMGGWILREVL